MKSVIICSVVLRGEREGPRGSLFEFEASFTFSRLFSFLLCIGRGVHKDLRRILRKGREGPRGSPFSRI
jgi:hypothetical protein